MLKYEHFIDFPMGTLDVPVPVRYLLGESVYNAEIRSIGQSILLFGVPKQNPPWVEEQWHAQLGSNSAEKRTQTIQFREQYRHRRAIIGWLRAAYIIAFAALGYRYALHYSLDRVRSQIQAPDENILPDQIALIEPHSDKGLRGFHIVDEPTWAASLVVVMGRHMVFLPFKDDRIYERLSDHARDSRNLTFSFSQSILWPERPRYGLDHVL
jgi:hypothetical protein